jgi:hypothetical protein
MLGPAGAQQLFETEQDWLWCLENVSSPDLCGDRPGGDGTDSSGDGTDSSGDGTDSSGDGTDSSGDGTDAGSDGTDAGSDGSGDDGSDSGSVPPAACKQQGQRARGVADDAQRGGRDFGHSRGLANGHCDSGDRHAK